MAAAAFPQCKLRITWLTPLLVGIAGVVLVLIFNLVIALSWTFWGLVILGVVLGMAFEKSAAALWLALGVVVLVSFNFSLLSGDFFAILNGVRELLLAIPPVIPPVFLAGAGGRFARDLYNRYVVCPAGG